MQCWLPFLALFVFTTTYVEAYRVVCYYGSWAIYRPGNGKFSPTDIDPTLCTHLIYTFVGIGSDGSINILDSWNEIDLGGFQNFNNLKQQSPGTKTMVAIGGWNAGGSTFSQVVNNAGARSNFVNNAVNFVKQYGFDGFDLDWEYPTQNGGNPSDKSAFATLVSELRQKFNQNGLILSAAVSAGLPTIDAAYDVPSIASNLDFINVMTYDLHGSWDPTTGENAPLYPGPNDQTTLNVDSGIQYWIKKGAPASKLNLGMGTYGRSFTLQSASNNGIGAPISGAGNAGPYTGEAGTLGYNEICEQQSQWSVIWNDAQKVPYAFKGNQWVGYDNVDSIGIKSQYIKDQGLGGAMIWSLETDDFHGSCGGGKYPLLSKINSVLNGQSKPATNPPVTQAPATKPPATQAPATKPPATQAPATQPPPPTTGVCSKEGYVRDPSNCAVFYYCQNVNGQFVASQFTCGAGTVYDTSIGSCNYKNAVKC